LKYSFQTGLLFFLCVATTFAQNTVLVMDSEPGPPFADDREAAILATLPVGSYTAIIRGKAGATGVALVEVYRLP